VRIIPYIDHPFTSLTTNQMKKILLLLLLIPSLVFAQKGIDFEHGLTWSQVKEKARAENKYIFMDAFTTWCGPCKQMAATIFPLEKVGEVFNAKFINVKVQLDTTKKDDDEVKSWYNDAHNIMVENKVNAFPTYLFFDPNGKLVHRAIGASDADKFIAKAMDAINPETQYYSLLEKYKAGNKDAGLLKKVATAALDAYDMETGNKVATEYLQTQKDFFTADNINFLESFTNSTKDPGFNILLNNPTKYDKIKGVGAANARLVAIIMQQEVFPKFRSNGIINWESLTGDLNKKYPKQAMEVVLSAKVQYYQRTKDWDNFQTVIQQYMKKYGAKASPNQLNAFAWTVFENCMDVTCLQNALEWSKRSFADHEIGAFIDTYANILYKLGKKEEAIKWEEKAIAVADDAEKAEYQPTLDKMKKGEKTWKE
jgi:thioredoxin-related protein